jgi:hypothetical protein
MAGTHGGRRPGAGRKPGAATVLSRQKANQFAAAEVTVLDVLQRNMIFWLNRAEQLEAGQGIIKLPANSPFLEDEAFNVELQIIVARDRATQCAVALAPYVHPKLAAIEHSEPEGTKVIFLSSAGDDRL